MGDWQDGYDSGMWGADGIPYGMDSWSQDYFEEKDEEEYEKLKSNGYQTVEEWNKAGRIIKKGEKGKYLRYLRIRLFLKEQTIESKYSSSPLPEVTENFSEKLHFEESHLAVYFEHFKDAMSWAKNNPGSTLTRAHDRNGFIVKKR